MNTKQQRTFISTAVTLLILAILYAIRIAKVPFLPRRTWLSVVYGDAITDLASAVMIYSLTGNWRAAITPIVNHVISGTPMIVGQMTKHAADWEKADAIEAEWEKAQA